MALEADLTKHLDEQKSAFEAFKAENDKGRAADKDMLARLEKKMNDAADAMKAAETKAVQEKARADEIEKKIARLELGGAGRGGPEKNEAKAAFFGFCRKGADRLNEAEKKALTVSDDTGSGYLSPVEYVKEILKDIVLFSPMRDLVRVRSTSSRVMSFPKRTRTAAAKWVGETEARTETQLPQYGMEEVPAHEMTAEAWISLQDLEDSAFDLEAELRQEFADQFAVSEGLALISGNGIGKPFGILDASQGIASVNSGTAATIADANGVADGLIDMVHALPSSYAANAVLCLNRKTLGSVRKMKDSQKRYIWEPSPAPGLPSTILGSRYCECPDMPDEGANKTPIAYGDWKRAYMLGDRLSMSIVRDPYSQADKAVVRFVARRRVAGKVVIANAARLLKCST